MEIPELKKVNSFTKERFANVGNTLLKGKNGVRISMVWRQRGIMLRSNNL